MKKFLTKDFTIFFFFLILIFIVRFGLDVLNPTSTNWILSAYHDWGQHYLGWAFFREEPINFPIGKVENYNFPAGTTIGYTDSIPLMAYFFKIFNFLLPENFQYLGLWLLLSHLLTGFFALKIIKRFSTNNVVNLLIALFIAFTPVILYRDMHPALTAHWLIVGSIYYYLEINTINYSEISKKILLFNILAALINPYLLFLSIAISSISFLKLIFVLKIDNKIKVYKLVFLNLFVVVLIWIFTGMLTFSNSVNMEVVNSYGLYSLNLNSFLNSESYSKIFTSLPKVSSFQYEGYSYLGLGGFVLLFFSFLVFLIDFKQNLKKTSKFAPLFLLSLVLLFFAISNKVTLNENLIFEFPLPELFNKIGNVFRATSRFVWLFYYFIIIVSFLIIIKSKISEHIKTSLIILIFVIQFYDVSAFFNKNLPKGKYKLTKLTEKRWLDITSNFKKIITYKPFNNHLSSPMDYQDLCLIALKNKLPITIGYVARESSEINKKFIDSLNLEIKDNNYSKENIFVISPKEINVFKSAIYQNKLELIKLDSYYLLYPKEAIKSKNIFQTKYEINEVNSIKNQINKEFNFLKITKPKPEENKIKYNIEEVYCLNNQIKLDGWAFLEQNNTLNDSVFIALVNDKNSYLLNSELKQRPDLVDNFKNKNLLMSGFTCTNVTSKFEPGSYEIYVGIKSNSKITYVNSGKNSVTIKKDNSISELKELPKISDKIIYNVEKAEKSNNNFIVEGWAALKDKDSNKNIIQVVLIGKLNYIVDVNYFKRADVTTSFKKTLNLNFDNSGFTAIFKKDKILTGNYKVGIIIINKNVKKLILSDKKIIIK